jgi:molybdate transport system substrate-binding protein
MRGWLIALLIALSSSASSADLKVMSAGSLKDAFTAVFADYTK